MTAYDSALLAVLLLLPVAGVRAGIVWARGGFGIGRQKLRVGGVNADPNGRNQLIQSEG